VIAIDSSTWIAFFSDREPQGDDTELLATALADHQACIPPVVLTELIAQTCIDHDLRLATRDQDFRHFVRLGGLRLAL